MTGGQGKLREFLFAMYVANLTMVTFDDKSLFTNALECLRKRWHEFHFSCFEIEIWMWNIQIFDL